MRQSPHIAINCAADDYACLCRSPDFDYGVSDCMRLACGRSGKGGGGRQDEAAARSIADQLCARGKFC